MNYTEYLQSPHWQSVRKWALERAGHKCQLCGSRKHLQVHHNSYGSLGEEVPCDLIVLCDPCHERNSEHQRNESLFWPVVQMSDGHLYQGPVMQRVG